MIQDRNQPISDAPWGRSLSIAIGDFLVAATPQWRCKNHRGWGLCSNWRYSKHLNTFDGLQVTGDLNMIDICSTGFSMMKSYQLKEAMIRRWSDSMAINNKGCSDHWWLISHIYIYIWTWYSQTLRFEHHSGFYAFYASKLRHLRLQPTTNSSCSRAASLDAIPLAHSIAECPNPNLWKACGFHHWGDMECRKAWNYIYLYNYILYIYRLWNPLRVCPKFLGPRWVDDREMICQPWNCLMGESQNQWWWSVQHQFLWLWWGLNISKRG